MPFPGVSHDRGGGAGRAGGVVWLLTAYFTRKNTAVTKIIPYPAVNMRVKVPLYGGTSNEGSLAHVRCRTSHRRIYLLLAIAFLFLNIGLSTSFTDENEVYESMA